MTADEFKAYLLGLCSTNPIMMTKVEGSGSGGTDLTAVNFEDDVYDTNLVFNESTVREVAPVFDDNGRITQLIIDGAQYCDCTYDSDGNLTAVGDVYVSGVNNLDMHTLLNLQSKTVSATAEDQVITADEDYDGLSSVTVRATSGGGGGGMINYSTDEQVIGTWIDGKPLYSKFILPDKMASQFMSSNVQVLRGNAYYDHYLATPLNISLKMKETFISSTNDLGSYKRSEKTATNNFNYDVISEFSLPDWVTIFIGGSQTRNLYIAFNLIYTKTTD